MGTREVIRKLMGLPLILRGDSSRTIAKLRRDCIEPFTETNCARIAFWISGD